ncbi:hypothetical protein [Mycoplana dimorpha]|uniref:2-oxoglutarate-Fe(II)-dependent oxygenase superfamily protein n=1 Tax=Mycoplana dimorpha TaxID=28320 RepID=A0A2T5BJ12_MYCDI|nr:hypothetical protein [Mycoplana dimorpha]PTM98977.1 hypothetical protein C7449_101647 [Mycoplana dimorpha]
MSVAAHTDASQGSFQTAQVVAHILDAVNRAAFVDEPFWHLEMTEVFPAELYRRMRAAMPEASEYRALKGRYNGNIQADGSSTRIKIDLFPEYIRHLPPEKRAVWDLVGSALQAPELKEAFMRRLAPGLERRFGADFMKTDLYPVPMLTRDVTGYKIRPHTDTRWKGITVQFYLPEDESVSHIGTRFDRQKPDGSFEMVHRMPFSPNTGYAFAVGTDTWHSVDKLGPEVRSRDSILHTYFVDETVQHKLMNRGKRVGNFLKNEFRHAARLR